MGFINLGIRVSPEVYMETFLMSRAFSIAHFVARFKFSLSELIPKACNVAQQFSESYVFQA